MAIKVFCCYAREDEKFLSRLRAHFKPLERNGVIEVWYDGKISPGTKWETEIHKRLNTAQIILFLVSPAFIDSDYCYDVEVREAVMRHEKGEARVIPIILRPVDWRETPFGQLQALPKNAKPLISGRNIDQAILNVVSGIKNVVYELLQSSDTLIETTSKSALPPSDDDSDPPSAEEEDPEAIADSDKYKDRSFEERMVLASQLLEMKHPKRALEHLQNVPMTNVSISLRWRISALKGQCHFALRDFRIAQQEFLVALAILPEHVPAERRMEALLLRLHLAAASRELGQYELAYEQFQDARAHMDDGTPLRLIAEAQWGMSLILYEQAYKCWNEAESSSQQDQVEERKEFLKLMQQARDYAENACALYNSINELSRSALMNCQIALIEQGMKNLDAARIRLQKVLHDWVPSWRGEMQNQSRDITDKVKRYALKERANIVSAAACYLASVELDARYCTTALEYAELALAAGQDSYVTRRADAYMTKGQILAAGDDPGAIVAFQEALKELDKTQRVGAKIRVHHMLGAYLIAHGQKEAGEAEQNIALSLANVPPHYQAGPDEGDRNFWG